MGWRDGMASGFRLLALAWGKMEGQEPSVQQQPFGRTGEAGIHPDLIGKIAQPHRKVVIEVRVQAHGFGYTFQFVGHLAVIGLGLVVFDGVAHRAYIQYHS